MFINKNKVTASVDAQVVSVKRNIGKVTVAFNNTPRSKANYRLRLLLSSINSVSKRDQEEVYFHELKSKRPFFVMSD